MATKKDIKPGTFETISGESIGTFILDEWTHFNIGDAYKYLVSDVVIKQGGATLPGSAYELATDAAATAQEVGKTDKTLSGQIRITNVAYVGVELTVTGSNFGTYGSNESVDSILNTGLSGKMEPGSDAFIDDGEPAVFDSATGTTVISDNSGEITKWDSGTVYSVAGTLVRLEGLTFSATGQASNQNKNPLLPNNGLYWFMAEDENDLLRFANKGTIVKGDMHTINDYSSGNYQQLLKIGGKKVNIVQQEFYLIHLDGTQITGNTTLETLLDVGGGNEYIYLDLLAPDDSGTRTLVDMRGRSTRAMTAGGGVAPTLAEIQEDQFQGHWHTLKVGGADGGNVNADKAADLTDTQANTVTDAITDGFNGTPRIGPETRIKAMVVGVDYVVVMVEQ